MIRLFKNIQVGPFHHQGRLAHSFFVHGTGLQAHLPAPDRPYPDGSDSLADSYAAMNRINTSLKDIIVFWNYHINELVDISASDVDTTSEITNLIIPWDRRKIILDDAIFSIYASADLVLVDATGKPQPSGTLIKDRRRFCFKVFLLLLRLLKELRARAQLQ
jgi:hypothetical protein